jgi:hypothetical protein
MNVAGFDNYHNEQNLRLALFRIAAPRDALFLLVFKLLLSQRIEAVRCGARGKRHSDKHQYQASHQVSP